MVVPTRPESKAIVIVIGSGIGLAFALAFAHGDNYGAMAARFIAASVFSCTVAGSLVLLFRRMENGGRKDGDEEGGGASAGLQERCQGHKAPAGDGGDFPRIKEG